MDRYDPYTDKFLRDTQYNIHGTNLAEVGTDCISKQQAIDALRGYLVGKRCPDDGTLTCRLIENEVINKLPPIQSDIVRCKDCRYYDFEEKECLDLLGHGRRWEEDDFCSYAERRWRRKHESN